MTKSLIAWVRCLVLDAVCLSVVWCGAGVAPAQTTLVQTAYSTHDFNSRVPLANEPDFLPAVWADVKTPGNGRTYSVGTVTVKTTKVQDGAEFSGKTNVAVPTYPFPANGGFTVGGQVGTGGSRQVVILQCCGFDPLVTGQNSEQSILWQNFWYGHSFLPTTVNPVGPWARRANNARGISVWPAATPADTRIAICGETYDMLMEKNQFNGQSGWNLIESNANTANPLSQNGLPNGFIAVYNGDGFLLWSFQFYFEDELGGFSAITDVSIRVEETPEGPRDVVTYCGISSFGVRSTAQNNPDQTLAPVKPFLAPFPWIGGNYTPGAGNTNNGVDQWDGIVGRLSNTHNSPVPTATRVDFHSVVGGVEQDGCWGIWEIDKDRFVVGAGTANVSGNASPQGIATFPFTLNNPQDWNSLTAYYVGAILVFDAGPTRTGGNLWLEASQPVGGASKDLHTHVRDVVVQQDSFASPAPPARIVFVGATDDPALFTTLSGGVTPTVAFGGVTDGFIVTARDTPMPPYASPPTPLGLGTFSFVGGSFHGGANAQGFTGVSAWNEHPDHVTAFGFDLGNLMVATFFSDTPNTGAPNALVLVRSDVVASAANEVPTAMGPLHATSASPIPPTMPTFPYVEASLRSPAGGGVTVDERGRVDIAGSTDNQGYPPTSPGPLERPFTRFGPSGTNGVRTLINMVPPGVGRTDGTGITVPIVSTADGGTTPACLRAPFGLQIGLNPPQMKRMLIDYEGLPPSAYAPVTTPALTPPNILVDRTPPSTGMAGLFLQYGFPSTTPWPTTPFPGNANFELWIDPSAWAWVLVASPGVRSLRFQLNNPPPGSHSFSIQAIALLSSTLTCTGPTQLNDYAASPALVFQY